MYNNITGGLYNKRHEKKSFPYSFPKTYGFISETKWLNVVFYEIRDKDKHKLVITEDLKLQIH